MAVLSNSLGLLGLTGDRGSDGVSVRWLSEVAPILLLYCPGMPSDFADFRDGLFGVLGLLGLEIDSSVSYREWEELYFIGNFEGKGVGEG